MTNSTHMDATGQCSTDEQIHQGMRINQVNTVEMYIGVRVSPSL